MYGLPEKESHASYCDDEDRLLSLVQTDDDSYNGASTIDNYATEDTVNSWCKRTKHDLDPIPRGGQQASQEGWWEPVPVQVQPAKIPLQRGRNTSSCGSGDNLDGFGWEDVSRSTDSVHQGIDEVYTETGRAILNAFGMYFKNNNKIKASSLPRDPVFAGNVSVTQSGNKRAADGNIKNHKLGVETIAESAEHSLVQDSNPTTKSQVPGLRFRSHQAENWMEKYEELLDFRLKNGHCLVPNAFKENPSLAEWVKRQRYQYKLKRLGQHSTMSSDRIAALEKIGFVWNSHDVVWEERLKELKEYKAVFNDCNVPSNYAPNLQLSIWVKRQRRQYKFFKEGKPSTMTSYRIARLTEIGFAWSCRKQSQS